MIFSACIQDAVSDYYYFLNRGYPVKPLLKLIGDRYQLTSEDRSLLFRGIFCESEAVIQKSRLVNPEAVRGRRLWIDGYNQLITVVSYLEGVPVFIGNDGVLRDVRESHGHIRKSSAYDRGADLIFTVIKKYTPLETVFFFDEPVSQSGDTAAAFALKMKNAGLSGGTEVTRSADYSLLLQKDGILATSDSQILQKTGLPVLDLARLTLTEYFQPDFYRVS